MKNETYYLRLFTTQHYDGSRHIKASFHIRKEVISRVCYYVLSIAIHMWVIFLSSKNVGNFANDLVGNLLELLNTEQCSVR